MNLQSAKTDEIWKMVQGFPMYDVSNKGRVRSYYRRKLRYKIPTLFNYGYMVVSLSRDSKTYLKLVHRLVLEAFVCLCPKGLETNHKDGIKTNNHLSNLEWISRGDNISHAYGIGLRTSTGENNP